MMYIWELLIRAKQEEVEEKSITFQYPKRYSPYMELNYQDINTSEIQSSVDVNPYYRFYSIFKNFMPVDNKEDKEIKEVLFDLVIHYLGNLDKYQGMNLREYYIQFVIRDIERGLFGSTVKNYFSLFNTKEKKNISNHILRLYKTGEGVYLFLETLKLLFQHVVVYANAKEKNIMIVYMKTKKTEEREKKLEVLKHIFLPFKYELEIYWEFLFGIVGEEDFMHQEEMIIY